MLSFVALTTGPPWIAFGAAFCVLVGFSFMVPEATSRFSAGASRFLTRWRRFGYRVVEANLAAGNLCAFAGAELGHHRRARGGRIDDDRC